MMARTASPRIAAAAASALAKAEKSRVLVFRQRPPSMPSKLPRPLPPPPAASLPRGLPVACSYLGQNFVPLASAKRSSRQRAVVSCPALGKDRLVLVTLSDDDEDDELERVSSLSSSSSSSSPSPTLTSSSGRRNSGSSGSSSSGSSSKRRRPLVILFGWLGARAKDLAKYSEAWQALGYDTLTARPPLAAVLLPPLGSRAADSVLSLAREALLLDAGEEDRKVIAHVFSNAGFLFSGTCLAREAEEEQQQQQQQSGPKPQPPLFLLRSRLRGVIFDSCPARVDEDMALRGISAAARGVPAARAKEAPAAEKEEEPSASTSTSTSSSSSPHSILSPPPPPVPVPAPTSSSLRDSALRLALRAFLRSGPIERAMDAAWRAWEGGGDSGGSRSGEEENGGAFSPLLPPPAPPSCPRVYAYSLTDALIPPESVEAVAAAAAARAEEEEEKKKKNRREEKQKLLPAVSLRVFDSPHCEHLRWHPREYLELMESFSRAIVEEEENEGEDEEKGEGAILQV